VRRHITTYPLAVVKARICDQEHCCVSADCFGQAWPLGDCADVCAICRSLRQLVMFKHFYIMVLCYIYFTRYALGHAIVVTPEHTALHIQSAANCLANAIVQISAPLL
jgi:hypothetical protein